MPKSGPSAPGDASIPHPPVQKAASICRHPHHCFRSNAAGVFDEHRVLRRGRSVCVRTGRVVDGLDFCDAVADPFGIGHQLMQPVDPVQDDRPGHIETQGFETAGHILRHLHLRDELLDLLLDPWLFGLAVISSFPRHACRALERSF